MDGNAQNMYHGGGGAGHQGDPYYRSYDPNGPRGMGPPPGTPYGATARHRQPHPAMQQPQQSQYPGYQPAPTDGMYGMGADQHPGMGGLGDLTGGWGAQPPPQANPYGMPTGYGHPQTPQQQQRQPPAQSRQHMSGYPQQDPQKMAYGQQGMMTGMGYGGIGQPQTQPTQQQSQQQRVPQHYGQATSHMYPGAPQAQPTATQQYGYGMPAQMGPGPQTSHVGYGHAPQLDQTSYGRHMTTPQPPPGHHGHGQQQPPQSQIPPHPTQQTQQQPSHLGGAGQGNQGGHLTGLGAPQPNQMHPAMQGHPGLPQQPPQTSQNHLSAGAAHLSQPQIPQQSGAHPQMLQQMGIPHGMPGYQPQGPVAQPAVPPQQPSYVPNVGKPSQQPPGNSPQYRTTYPQLSPGMSPRGGPQQPQLNVGSPHPQMSPRPVMSPAKPTTQQPAPAQQAAPQMGGAGIGSPRAQQQSAKPQGPPQNTLQALEQLVGPNSSAALGTMDYNAPQAAYRPHQMQPSTNPMSPMTPRLPPTQHQPWQQTQQRPLNGGAGQNSGAHLIQGLQSMPQTMSTAQQQTTPLPPVSEMLPQTQPQHVSAPVSNMYSMEALTQPPIPKPLQQTQPNPAQMQQSPLMDSIMSPPSMGQQPQVNQNAQQPPMIMTPPTVMEPVKAATEDPILDEPLLETSGSTAGSVAGSSSGGSVAGSAGSETPKAPSEEETEKEQMGDDQEMPERDFMDAENDESEAPLTEEEKADVISDVFEVEKPEKNDIVESKLTETTTVEELTSTVEEPTVETTQIKAAPPVIQQPVVALQPLFGSMHYPSPIMHDAERAALQQQIQELCCISPSSQEMQDKIKRLQERLNLLQQHEANDACNGGPECILQTPFSAMIDSPQVSSTTGRGRGRNSNKPRKPRSKKGDKTVISGDDEVQQTASAIANLPVSEDSVTAGTGDVEVDPDASMDATNESIEDATSTDGKKLKKPRKPRAPKSGSEKPSKERKKKEPKESRSKKKSKKEPEEEAEDIGGDNSTQLSKSSLDENQSLASLMHNQNSTDANAAPSEVTDFDDIPVNKISKDIVSDGDGDGSKRSVESDPASAAEDGDNSTTPKKRRPYRKTDCSDRRRRGNRGRGKPRPPGQRAPRRGRIQIIADSDDDMVGSPPPSPPVESEIDSSKRRSARNTCRKKYTDDIMLRFSDDENNVISPSPKKKEGTAASSTKDGAPAASSGSGDGTEETNSENVTTTDAAPLTEETGAPEVEKTDEVLGKPNYVYINTSDEDQMVVQFVLAQRVGKRELRPEPPPVLVVKEEPKEAAPKEETELDPKEEGEKDESENKPEEDKKEEEKMETEEDEPKKEEKEKEEEKAEPMETDADSSKKEEEEEEQKVVEKPDSPKTEKSDEIEAKTEEEEPREKEEVVSSDEKSEKPPKTEEKPKEGETSEEKLATDEKGEAKEVQYVEVEEFLVKYRNFSYLHCEWRTEEELLKGDKRVSNKIRRFQQKQAQQLCIFDNIEDEPFNPDFVEVDRVLDVSEHTDDDSNTVKHYLVKWKSLPYEDSTWELEEDVDQDKIEQFERFTKVPPKSEWKPKRRPHPDQWKQLDKTPIYKNSNSLRPYQLEGLNWLRFSWYKGNNCILADEMGLGKTIQSLTFIHSVYSYGIRGPFLVIAPLSTIPNWQREFENWTDMNVIVYHGSATSRQMINDYEVYYKTDSGKVIKDVTKFNVLITTFEMIVTDYQDLQKFTWRVCVIDEAHRLKNRNCKLLEGLRQLHLEHRVLLSGTPLQNNVNELFSLLNFLEPTQFASSDDFCREFGSLKSEDEVSKLQALLKPMMLRRLKDDVEKSLAPKEETIVEVELTNIQKKYYRGIMEQNFSFLQKGTTSANIPNLMNTMMELRKCCIHPYLLNGAEEQIQYDYRLQNGEDQEAYYKNLIASSGKMVLIDKLLPKLKSNGHRVLIFSQMVRCLDILEDYLIYRKYPYERIDGRIRGNLRQAAIDRYSKPDSDRFVFLLCTKAGGLGINLTAADTVIIYDSDWNPQNDLQAQARCHRIGQQKMVKIYRLLCRNTYEREMFDKASLKLGLDKAILQSMNTAQGKDAGNKQLSKKEVEDLLKKGAYGAIMDDENEGDKFCEEDIDSILQRRTQIITMESEQGSTFSKASFASSNNRSDINIDDPDFWNKWAKKAEIDPNACERNEDEELILAEPRRRTQIKRYGQEDGIEGGMSEDSSAPGDSDDDNTGVGLRSRRRRDREKAKKMKQIQEDYIPRDRDTLAALGFDEVSYGSWARSECFKVEKGLLSHGWGRWSEILEQGQFKRGWREQDVEDCARIILLFCLIKYQGDEKIKSFIWELIAPVKEGEELNINRSHSGLHNLVPRGRNAKGRKGKGTSSEDNSPKPSKSIGQIDNPLLDESHWCKDEKYDAEAFLEPPYKKHLTRHANKVLLRVRMLYYIRHEVIGEHTQLIDAGISYSEIPIRPPPMQDQVPVSWWNPNCCDRSLLIGTYKHGCENYRQIRADPKLCFVGHCGPGEGVDDASGTPKEPDDDNNSKQGDDENDEDLVTDARSASVVSKDKEDQDRPNSSGVDDEEKDLLHQLAEDSHYWPTMQDLNTRLRRVITAYQRNYKKEELKQQQKQKLQPIVTPAQLGLTPSGSAAGGGASSSSSNASTPVPGGSNAGSVMGSHYGANASATMPSPADLSLMLSLGLGLNPADASQLANLDLQKLAQYLKMERREKAEQVVRERERMRFEQIHKKWTRREENEFLRVLTGYGIDLVPNMTILTPDWSRFKAFAKLDKKSDEQMCDYYKVFIAMCKRQAGVKLLEEERNLEGYIDEISEDHAKLVLDRLDLLSKLREIAKHPKLDERIKLCENNLDTPDWWEPGKHDRELIRAVLKHGLYRSDQFILNDTEFSFYEAEKKYLRDLEAHIQRVVKAEKEAQAAALAAAQKEEIKPEIEIIKTEKTAAEKAASEEPIVEKEKPEEEVKVEEVTEKEQEKMETDETPAEKTEVPEVSESVEKTEEVSEETKPEIQPEIEPEAPKIPKEPEEKEAMEVDEAKPEEQEEKKEDEENPKEPADEEKPQETETPAVEEEKPEEPKEDVPKDLPKEEDPPKVEEEAEPMEVQEKEIPVVEPEEKPVVEEEPVKPEEPVKEEVKAEPIVETPKEEPKIEDPSKQAAELKARYPDLEVFQPLMKLKQLDSLLKDDAKCPSKPFSNFLDTTMVVKWFRDFALEKRLGHIVYCIDNNEWPVGKSYSAYTGCLGIDLDAPLYETIKRVILVEVEPRRSATSTPDIITITTDHQNLSKQLQEAAALRSSVLSSQALNQSMAAVAAAPGRKGKGKRHIAIDVETERAKLHALLNNTQNPDSRSRRSTNTNSGNTPQPPPAHQHRSTSSVNYKSTVIPGTSSTLTPIDLSGGSLPKMSIAEMLKNPMDLSEVQDFSMPSKSKGSLSSSLGQGKSKLNDMLSKLMKKNNVSLDEPPVTIEKKRRKLDEIVLGLSAAKESPKSIFDSPFGALSSSASKKQQITPSVSVTPASAPSSQSNQSHQQKPFTITVTSVPGTSKGGSQSQSQSAAAASAASLAALQSMTGLSGLSSKDALSAAMFLQQAQQEQQNFLKQQQKLINQLPANSTQRKQYEAMFSDMKQMAELSAKLGGAAYSPHDAKVNKWLQEQTQALAEQAVSLDYLSRASTSHRTSSSSQQQSSSSANQSRQSGGNSGSRNQRSSAASQSQAAAQDAAGFNWKNLTGEENVAVIHKYTGKKLTGSKAPQLKRLTQWLNDNQSYEIDPKWAESLTRPQSQVSVTPKSTPSPSASELSKGRNVGQSRDYQQPSTSKSSKSSSSSSQMQYPGLSGLNSNLLSSLPGLGAFDPKNPLMMPFAGMPGLSGMGGLNNMNLFANLAGLGLSGMDAQSLAAMMQAAGFDPASAAALAAASGTGASSSTPTKQQSSSKSRSKAESTPQASSSSASTSGNSSSKVPTSSASSSAAAAAAMGNSGFPFFFPNPSLLYTPLGLGGLNPYSLPGGMTAYDQLAQQCQLLNGGAGMTSGSSSGSPSGKSSGGASKQSNAGSSGRGGASGSASNSSPSNSSKRRGSDRNMDAVSQLPQLLPHDTHLLETLSRTTGLDVTQSSSGRGGGGRDASEKRSAAAAQANKEAIEKLERERRKLIENLTRSGFPPDLALQAFNVPGTSLSSSSSKKSSKDPLSQLPMPPADFSQALLQEMAAAAAQITGSSGLGGSSSSSSKRSHDQQMKDAFEQFSKNPVEMLARSLGVGPGISLIPTSSTESSKRMRADSHSSTSSRASVDIKLAEELKSPRPSRSAQEDKVTLTPVSASQIAPTLPSQTTISLAPPSKSQEEARRVEDLTTEKSKAEDLSAPVRSEKSNHEIDIEDMIAPVKVSKESGVVMPEERERQAAAEQQASQEESHDEGLHESSKDSSRKRSNEDANSDGRSAGEEHQGEDGEERRGRRTRSKRSRTEEFSDPQPERRRELRSSAGRLAAAAARRMAAEAKAAAEEAASMNLSQSGSGGDTKGDEST